MPCRQAIDWIGVPGGASVIAAIVSGVAWSREVQDNRRVLREREETMRYEEERRKAEEEKVRVEDDLVAELEGRRHR